LGLGFNRKIDHLRDFWPAVAGAQAFADHKAEIENHRGVTLFDRFFCPIGSFVDLAADQVEERMGAGLAERLALTKFLGHRF
jgi:hypothetical protein